MYAQRYFFECEITTIIAGNFETILSVRKSVSLSILRSTIVSNAFSSHLETHKSQIFPMIASRGVAKLSTSPNLPLPFDKFPSTSALQFQFRSVPEM